MGYAIIKGDVCNLLATIILLVQIWKTKSCAGISGKSQILYTIACTVGSTTRYKDFLPVECVPYFTSFLLPIKFIVSYATIFLIYHKFKATYDHNHDTIRIEILIIASLGLTLMGLHRWQIFEIWQIFGIYMESVAILPQLFMTYKTAEAQSITIYYLIALGAYRESYMLDWFGEYYETRVIVPGILQTVLYCAFLYLYKSKVLNGKEVLLPT